MMQRSRLVIIAQHTRVGFASAYPVPSTLNEVRRTKTNLGCAQRESAA